MRREIELRQRVRTLRTLHDAVGAMKGLAARHFRDARASLATARAYRDGVERILGETSATLQAGSGARGLLVVGADLGLCGGYNARVVEAAVAARQSLGPGPTLCLGRRAAVRLARRGISPGRQYTAATSVSGIPEVLLRVAQDLLSDFVEQDLASLDIVASRFTGLGSDSIATTRLLPIAPPTDGRPRPARYVGAERLAAAVVREVLYIRLYELLLDALAAEHGARLLATQSAEDWLEDRSTRVGRQLAATMRETSTQEVLEVAAGARLRGTTTAS